MQTPCGKGVDRLLWGFCMQAMWPRINSFEGGWPRIVLHTRNGLVMNANIELETTKLCMHAVTYDNLNPY